jgi:hypothetical protein
MTELTSHPGVLRVASAFPDPPFEVTVDGEQTGFDRELMQAICDDLGLSLRPVPYGGDDFDGIFDGLEMGATTPSYLVPPSRPNAKGRPSSPHLTCRSTRALP